MSSGWFVTAGEIKTWTDSNKRRAEELLPMLVRRLIGASCNPKHLHFPSGDSVSIGGWDGTLEVDEGDEIIPTGKSVWEFGTDRNIKAKADNDYQKRTDNPGNLIPLETSFLFVTSRTWQKKDEWCAEKNAEGIWRQIRGLNADDLEYWLQQCPSVHRWFSNLIGKRTEAVWDIEQAWNSWSHSTSITANYDLVLRGRNNQSEELSKSLKDNPAIIRIRASSENEAYAFTLATLMQDADLAPKVLIIKDQNQWDVLLDSQNTLILVPQGFTPANIGYAKQKGHFVVIPVDSGSPRTTSMEIYLEKMSRDDVISALQSLDLSKDQAEEIYSDTRGYLGPIRRHELLGPQESLNPPWIDQFDSKIITTILMATEWDSRKEKDREAVSKLAAIPYEQFEEQISQLASVADPPVRLVGSIWQAISKIDLWSLISHKVNRQSIERLESVVFDVLNEPDPSYDLAPEERWMANIKGAVPEYSDALKSGLADTIALFAVFGDKEFQNIGDINIADRVSYWVRELLKKDSTARGWYSFGGNLIPLAEAAPESFLQALESIMQGSEPPILPIFEEGGDFGRCPHSNLLWALEALSWSLNYLSRVTQALARLSEIDPGGRYSNRPFNSLKEIFLGWINNTQASHEERLQVIDSSLIRFYPNMAWKLLIVLLPKTHGVSSPIHKPKYRDWAENMKKEVTNRDYHSYIEGIADRLLNLVDEEPQSRWPELIKNITRFPTKKHFEQAINKLTSFNLDELGEEFRHKIADNLRDTISHHRKFKDADWAWPKEEIDKLEEAHDIIIPDDPILRSKHLFDDHFPDLINPVERKGTDYSAQEEIVEKYRIEALEIIHEKCGINGIKQLANGCDYPGFIGYTISKSRLRDALENEIFGWLDSGNDRLILVARSFVSSCVNIDKGFVDNTLKQAGSWSKERGANFLLGLPFNKDTLAVLEKSDKEVKNKYWENVDYYFLKNGDREKINWVMEQLLENGRPLAAVDAAIHALHGSRTKVHLDCKLLGAVLRKIVVEPSDKEKISISHVRHDILEAIKYLQEQGTLSKDEIAQIEWMYLGVFRFESVSPKFLENEVLENPAFFVQLVTWIYKPDNGQREAEDLDEDSMKMRASNAWELLSDISVLPGQQENGLINTEKLKAWVMEAREQLIRSGRKGIGDDQIGKILSNSPSGKDGIWPHEAIRDIIEEIRSPELEEALEVGRRNLRGVTSRAPFSGGNHERDIAKHYHELSEKIKLQWPRTSEILRGMERSYQREADWHDQRVELIE